MKAILPLLALLVLLAAENNNFDYKTHGDDWAEANPDLWADCDPNNQAKTQQSPIILSEGIAKPAPSFLFSNFYAADGALSLLNTTVYLRAATFGEIYTKTVRGDIIVMKATQMRFRSHAEHKFQAKDFYDLEMQVFFTEAYPSSRNERLGLAIMFQVEEGASSPLLRAILDGKEKAKVNLNLAEFLNNEQPFDFFYYLGSPTVPPCRDSGLEWIVSKKVFKMSQAQRDFFWNMFHSDEMEGNYRKIQDLKGNKVDYYHFSSL